jgi:hypothetical protein
MAYKPSELLTLADQLRLLMKQGIVEDEAKARLRKLFELQGRSIYSPKYIFSYEAALIDWATGRVALRRFPRQVFTPTLTAATHFAHFPERGSGDTAEVPVTGIPSADQPAPEAPPGAVNRKPAMRTASYSDLKAVMRPPSRLKPFWSDAEAIAMGWLEENGCPQKGDGNQAKLERFVAGWLEERGF